MRERAPWLVDAGRGVLRAWLYWHPQLGLEAEAHLRTWLEEAMGFDGSRLGRLTKENEARLAAAVQRLCPDAGRVLRLAAQLLEGRPQHELALLRGQALEGADPRRGSRCGLERLRSEKPLGVEKDQAMDEGPQTELLRLFQLLKWPLSCEHD